jgi:hypothetical protein
MPSLDDPWLTLALLLLFGVALFLRAKFPQASPRAQAMVLIATAILFFTIGRSFVTPTAASFPPRDERIEMPVAR